MSKTKLKAKKRPYADLRDTSSNINYELLRRILLAVSDSLQEHQRVVERVRSALYSECDIEYKKAIKKHGEARALSGKTSRFSSLARRLGNAEECLHGFGSECSEAVYNLRAAAKLLTGKKSG